MIDDAAAGWTRVTTGRSGDDLWVDDGRTRYRKRGADGVRREWARLRWLAGRVPVPDVLDFRDDGVVAELTTRALPGTSCTRPHVMAAALRILHALPVVDCPFDAGWDARLADAADNVSRGDVDESDFEPENIGRSAGSILEALRAMPPPAPDAVLIHGDACVPNVLSDGDRFTGLVDLGRAGVGCRALDLALAHRSLEANLGAGAGDAMLLAYGPPFPSAAELRRWRLLDELF